MKQIRLVTAALLFSGAMVTVSEVEGEPAAPPPPRPFKVENEDGTTTTVTPKRGNARLSVQNGDVPTQVPAKHPGFLTNSAPRDPKTGYYVAGMLGFNIDAFQGNNIQNWFGAGDLFQGSPNIFNGADSNMSLGPMAALKLGYVWPFGEPVEQFSSETGGLRLAGALEGEVIYLHGFHEFNQANGVKGEVQQITFAPMLNALLKGYFGRSEIYVGPGIGVAMTLFDGDGGGAQDDDSFGDLAYQFILGYEFHMNEEWSIFTESKYLQIQDIKYLTRGDSANVLLGIGIKKQL